MKKQIVTTSAPSAIGPYSQAIEVAGTLFVSGQIPVDPTSGAIPETVTDQATRSLTNLCNIISAAGYTTNDVVKTTVFITDIADFAAVNDVYAKFFAPPYPARSCVQVAALPKGVKVEIEAIVKK